MQAHPLPLPIRIEDPDPGLAALLQLARLLGRQAAQDVLREAVFLTPTSAEGDVQ